MESNRITQPLPALPELPVAVAPPEPMLYREPAPAPARRTVGRGWLAGMLGLSMLVGGMGGGAATAVLNQTVGSPVVVASAPVSADAQPVAATNVNSIGTLYSKVAAQVVQVQTTTGGGRFSGGGEGSGIVIDANHVLTNYHVVQGARTIQVILQDGTSIAGTVAGTSQADDLAVIQVALPADKVEAATLGDSDSVQVGEEVVAVGNPFGLDHTVTAGIVSAVNRQWSANSRQAGQSMIQTDAAINPGNSGGPLFNMQGQVIGINTAIESPVEGSVGVGFAIPINRVKGLLGQLTR